MNSARFRSTSNEIETDFSQKDLHGEDKELIELKEILADGDMAIIPIGFRCHTSIQIKKRLGIFQASLPFDSGFFPIRSIAQMLEGRKVDLQHKDNGLTHKVCMKFERNMHPQYGNGIKFITTNYDYINDAVMRKDQPGVNKYLDATFGYYTLDCHYNYVLAHYNWHRFSDFKKSKGVVDPAINLQIASDTINKRIERMLEVCKKAKRIVFIFHEEQGYKYMQIDDQYHMLDDFSLFKEICDRKFGCKYKIFDLSEISSVGKLIGELRAP